MESDNGPGQPKAPAAATFDDLGRRRGLVVDTAILLGLTGLTLLVHFPLLRWGINLGDEGLLAQAVERIRDGEVLYRDFHHNYAPGLGYGFAALFDWFGASLLVVRVVWLACAVCTVGLVYWLGRTLVSPAFAIWPALLPALVAAPNHKAFVPLAIAVALALCLALASERIEARGRVVVGVGIGIVALFRQEVGGYALAIGAVTLALSSPGSWRRVAELAAGTAVVWIPVVLAFAGAGALLPAIDQLVTGGLEENAWMALPFPPLVQVLIGPDRIATSLYFFPAIACLAGLAMLSRGVFAGRDRVVLAQWIAMALLTHSEFLSRSDLAHVKQGLVAPSLIVATTVMVLATRSRAADGRDWSRRLASLGAVGIAVWALSVLYWGATREILPAHVATSRGVMLSEPRARVILSSKHATLFSRVLARIRARTSDGEPVLMAPYIPMLSFLSERPNPTRYSELYGVLEDPEVQREVVAALDEQGVDLVVIYDVPLDGRSDRRFPVYAPILARHLSENFTEAERIGPFLLLSRGGRS